MLTSKNLVDLSRHIFKRTILSRSTGKRYDGGSVCKGIAMGSSRSADTLEYRTRNNHIKLAISPKKALIDDVIHVKVTRLRPRHHVTLLCRVLVDRGQYFSTAVYQSDQDGTVDLLTLPALEGGSYLGVEPMGLIWSQKAEPGQRTGIRLIKKDVTTPIETNFYVFDGVVSPTECLEKVHADSWLAHDSCDRIHMAEGVQRVEVRDGRLLGTLFIPPGDGPFPGVVDLFGTIGGIVEHRSAMLASRGIASLALCYYDPNIEDGMVTEMEYFQEAVDYLLSHEKVLTPHVGFIGVSMGAILAVIFASYNPQVRVCVEINGFHAMIIKDVIYKGRTIPGFQMDLAMAKRTAEGLSAKPCWECFAEADLEKHGAAVEMAACEFLLIHGEDDQNVGSTIIRHCVERLDRHGRTNYRLLVYPGAGHLIEPPHSPHFRASYNPYFREICLWGGEAKLHARAQEDAWKRVLHLFKSKLGAQSKL